jgi:hypothetical protein
MTIVLGMKIINLTPPLSRGFEAIAFFNAQ